MTRSFFKVIAMVLTTCAAAAGLTQTLDPKSVELAKTVPIADIHMHTYSRNGPGTAEVVERMAANNIRWGGGVGDLRIDIADALRGRHIPAAGQREFAESFFRQGPSALVETENVYFRDLFRDAHDMFS